MTSRAPPKVAIFPWGDVVEEFLDPIGLDLDAFAQRMTGGWLFGYVAAFQSLGWDAVILCASERLTTPRCLTHAGTGAAIWAVPGRRSIARRDSIKSARQILRTPWRAFRRILRSEGCSIVLVQEYEYARFDALAVLARLLGLPVFATFQGGDLTLSPLEARIRPWTLRLAQGLIVPSTRERERLARTYKASNLRIADIPNPIDADEWRASSRSECRSEWGLPEQDLVVVNHGRIDMYRKGLDVLLAAWSAFSDSHPTARLLILGSGPDQAAFGEAIGGSGAKGIIWENAYSTDRPRLRRWLSAADIYVTTSRVEGMPVAPLEAMACGLPVVASRAHGLPDIFRDGEASGGILVDCEDTAGVANALSRLADAPKLCAELGRAARACIETRFAIPVVAGALSRLMAKSRSGT
ncbi:glycosyltransferase family 4 protein [Thiocapsa roseopersicina]|uniref:Starch synthase n=1 Tax=Thiocapsa roseopersicina TaxID=1058 RepID=A0A1H2Y342_THIRO|nr:glycosyltransferase family 4 protein [Thiocapsa roseopersicina]SDW99471.1 starch synthase [Thiocapsa roseopersicina]